MLAQEAREKLPGSTKSLLKTGFIFKDLLSAFSQVFPLPASPHLPASTCQVDNRSVIFQTVTNLNRVAYFL